MSKTINVGKVVPQKGIDYFDGIDGVDGKSLEFNWNNTQLGIKQEGQQEYQYQDLQGPVGPAGRDGTNGTNGRDGAIQYTAGDNITIDENNVISASGGDLSNYYTKSEVFKTFVVNVTTRYTINDSVDINAINLKETNDITQSDLEEMYYLLNNNIKFNVVINFNTTAVNPRKRFTFEYTGTFGSLPTFTCITHSYGNSDYYIMYNDLYLKISYNNDTYTLTDFRVINHKEKYLQTNNTVAYTPSSDYHPATKKYVDDEINLIKETVELPVGVASGFYLDIQSNQDKLLKIIKNYYDYSLEAGANKTIIPNNSMEITILPQSSISAKCNQIDIYKYSRGEFSYDRISFSLRFPTIVSAGSIGGDYVSSPTYIYNITYNLYAKIEDEIITGVYSNATCTAQSTTVSASTGKFYGYDVQNQFLKVNNTTSYIPTGDYHPATKKYVDDSISNKIWIGTQDEYDALSSYSDSTLYFIKEDTNAS